MLYKIKNNKLISIGVVLLAWGLFFFYGNIIAVGVDYSVYKPGNTGSSCHNGLNVMVDDYDDYEVLTNLCNIPKDKDVSFFEDNVLYFYPLNTNHRSIARVSASNLDDNQKTKIIVSLGNHSNKADGDINILVFELLEEEIAKNNITVVIDRSE